MSATTPALGSPAAGGPRAGGPAGPGAGLVVPGGVRVTQLRVIRSEWTKLWSLRSTRWTLLAAFVIMAGLGPLIAAITMARWNDLTAIDRATFDPIRNSFDGFQLAQLAIGVLGVLVISGEYSAGMIRASLMAVPKRLPMLWGKIVVFAAVGFVLMLIAALVAFFASQSIFSEQHLNVPLSQAPAVRTLFGVVLYMTLTGVLCIALGTIIRSTAGGISTYVAVLFVLPGIVLILPSSISNAVHPYLPSVAGQTLASTTRAAHTFSPWGGFALYCGYVAVVVAVAAYLLVKRDA